MERSRRGHLTDANECGRSLATTAHVYVVVPLSHELRTAFENHLEETRGHVDRLEQVFGSLDEKVRRKHCDGIAGIIEEGKTIMEEDFEGTALDACLIAAAQRAEHYEMAAYGTLVAWARAMGHSDAAGLLEQILEEEKAADQKLTTLAEGGINQDAAEQAHSGENDDEEAPPARRSRPPAGKRSSGGRRKK